MSISVRQQTDTTGSNMEPGRVFQSSLSAESSHSGDSRPRRKLQKSPSEAAKAMRKREVPSVDSEESPRALSGRRPSIRHYKPPQGARPLRQSPSKSIPSDDALSSTRSVQPSQRSVDHTRPTTGGANQFNFNVKPTVPISDLNNAVSSPPEVNFDDFHTNITATAQLHDSEPSDLRLLQAPRPQRREQTAEPRPRQTSMPKASESRVGRTNSILRQQQDPRRRTASGQNKVSAPNMQDLSTAQAVSSRSRRQSHYQAGDSKSNAVRSSRKSVGPGFFQPDEPDLSFLKTTLPNTGGHTRSMVFVNPTGSEGASQGNAADTHSTQNGLGLSTAARAMKRKSMQPSRNLSGPVASPSAPDSPWATTPASAGRSPGRDSLYGANTPSSGKRLSMMPGHATGLGARTISPTDARRMKRMSMVPAPPLPQTPPVTFQESMAFPAPRSTAASPSLIPRKSITPSSNRTTPDQHRKSFNSAISIASSASLGSLRGAAGSSRAQQNASRLPTLKLRSDTAMAGTQEVVPPVPAIPKAYESPKTEQEAPLYPLKNTGVTQDVDSSFGSISPAENEPALSSTTIEKSTPRAEHETRSRLGHIMDRGAQFDDQRASGAQDGRRTLQPIQLPPLNLMPSNKPKGKKWLDQPTNKSPEAHTPPPRRGQLRTPTTPMTASRATFFHPRQEVDEPATLAFPKLRSNSSHFAKPAETPSARPPSSNSVHVTNGAQARQQAVSPFISTSVPKTNGTYVPSRTKQPGSRSASTVGIDIKSPRLTGPRSQNTKTGRAEPANGAVTPATDTESTSFGTTLRRKLSLTRRRSSSKAEGERPTQAQDREAMPPPKLPASATWNSGLSAPKPDNIANPPNPKPTYLHTRRKSSISDGLSRRDRTRSEVFLPVNTGDKTTALATENSVPNLPKTATSSLATGLRNHAASGLKVSTRAPFLDTMRLDKDDLLAEDEMRRLASKRRHTEMAARELDELRRRATAKDPRSPSHALRTARLNLFERGEIVDYHKIYFSGASNAKKLQGDLGGSESVNFGYDDDRGDYNIVLGDHLAYRYEVIDLLGKGSFGQVVRCIDHKTGGLVAIKIIRNKKRFHQQALVEVNILQKLRDWDPENKYSMVNFTQSFYFRGHLCISTELLGMNLYEFIKTHEFKGFSLKLIRRFTKQLLNSLVLLKGKKVIHCDLKPENILLAHPARSEIKVIDFGSSCMENEKVYTYIQSRFYRSPEVILGTSYGMPIDMWSLGCILAELLTGYPIFPGENEQEQLACIMEVFGPPDKHLIEKSSRRKLFFDSMGKPRLTVSSKGKRRRPSSKTLQQALKCEDEAFLDFISRCLRWDPDRRMKPDEAVQHEFMTGVKPVSSRSGARVGTIPQAVSTSPIKRFNSVHTAAPASARPLPEPPANTMKNVGSLRSRESLVPSPPKYSSNARHSTMPNSASTSSIVNARKTTANSALNGGVTSTLPRPGPKSGSANSRSGLASAAAAAAITKTR